MSYGDSVTDRPVGSQRGSRPSSPGELPAWKVPPGIFTFSPALLATALRARARAPESGAASSDDRATALVTSAASVKRAGAAADGSGAGVGASRWQATSAIEMHPSAELLRTRPPSTARPLLGAWLARAFGLEDGAVYAVAIERLGSDGAADGQASGQQRSRRASRGDRP